MAVLFGPCEARGREAVIDGEMPSHLLGDGELFQALTTDGVVRTHLGYDMVVKLRLYKLLGREYLTEPTRNDRHAPGMVRGCGRRVRGGRVTRGLRGRDN